MESPQTSFKQRFFTKLEHFLAKRDEETLEEAYELGRNAIEEGIGELEFLSLYHEAILNSDLLENRSEAKNHLRYALHFLSECLAPYELRQRGFIDLIEKLNEQNQQLQEEIENRKNTEEELRQSKEYFQHLIENALDTIAVINYDCSFRYASPSLERILGYKPAELIGKSFFASIHPEDEKRLKPKLDSILSKPNALITAEVKGRHKDGTWRHLECIAKNITSMRGGGGIIVNARDVTDRFKAHQKLKKSQNQLAAAQQIASLGSWEWSVGDNHLTWSDELCEIYGVKPGNHPEDYQKWLEFLPEEERIYVDNIIKKAFTNREKCEFEHTINRPDGTTRTLYCMAEVLTDDEGEQVKMFGTGQDITKMKEVERKLRANSERLRNLSAKQDKIREKERIRIAREIHDELGQMLTVLKMDISLAMKNFAGAPSGLKKQISTIIERIDTIIRSVQRITTDLRPEVLDDLGLQEAIEWQASEFEKRSGIKLFFENNVELIDELSSEQSTAIFRIFQETLTNILRHARATKVNVQINRENNFFILQVHDNGKGITSKEIEHKNSLGIIGMRERSQFLGGNVEFIRDNGTKVILKIPLKKNG